MNEWFERGHVAIVTGGSRGLGKALARELLHKGLSVIIDGRDAAALARAHRELVDSGHVISIPGDVSDREHVHALVAEAKRLGRLDLVVNNASTLGETPLPRIDELTEATFDRLFAINVFAPVHLLQHALPLMRQSATATIVNVSSDAAREAYPTWGGYGASKAALEHVSRALAAELGDENIRVLVVDPGDMNTEMHHDAVPEADPVTLGDPADAARALLRAIAGTRATYERISLGEATLA